MQFLKSKSKLTLDANSSVVLVDVRRVDGGKVGPMVNKAVGCEAVRAVSDGAGRRVRPAVRKRGVSFAVYHDLIQGIVSALEARDPHTAEHSLRVADMVERTCRLMNLPADEVEAIHMAAHLHDIGKIGIPDAVLLKRSRLTDDEQELLRGHPRLGAQIVERVAGLAPVAPMVLHHHERWDGRGYPDGLAGEEIPLGSRIVAVCDSIDAMLGKRRSKRSMTPRECVQEIFANMGTVYDPDIAWFVLKRWDAIVGPVDFRDSDDFEAAVETCGRTLRCTVA